MLGRVLLSIVMALLTACVGAEEGNLDDGFYYIHLPTGQWVVEKLPKNRKTAKSIKIVKKDGSEHTVTSIDLGTYVLLCHEEIRTCKEIRPVKIPSIDETD